MKFDVGVVASCKLVDREGVRVRVIDLIASQLTLLFPCVIW